GHSLAWTRALWCLSLSAIASASPRVCATSLAGSPLDGSGKRASLPSKAAGPGAKVACRSLRSEMARIAAPVARRNSSTALAGLLVIAAPGSRQLHLARAVLQISAEAALEILCHHRALQLVALVEERD